MEQLGPRTASGNHTCRRSVAEPWLTFYFDAGATDCRSERCTLETFNPTASETHRSVQTLSLQEIFNFSSKAALVTDQIVQNSPDRYQRLLKVFYLTTRTAVNDHTEKIDTAIDVRYRRLATGTIWNYGQEEQLSSSWFQRRILSELNDGEEKS